MNNYPDINSEIKTSADYAIRVAKEKLNISLAYDESSLQVLEDLLEKAFQNFSKLSQQGKLEEKSIQQNTKIWGCYLGELIRHKLGGEWRKTGESYILWVNGISFYPHSFVHQRITTNSDYSVIQYYADVSNRISIFNESTDTSAHLKDIVQQEKKISLEEDKKTSRQKNHLLTYIALGLLVFCLLSAAVISISIQKNRPTNISPTQDWRASPYYISEAQFGDNWPFTVSEGLIQCIGKGIVLETSQGTYGLTGYTDTLGYTNIKDSGLWKSTPDGSITSYAVDLCGR